jgi:hypothetical protein
MENGMIPTIVTALRGVTHARFYNTERGYQGELLAELRLALPELALDGDAVVEQEYQKRMRDHGIDRRPDIIIHVPTSEGGDRRAGNLAVFELNFRAGPKEAQEDFDNLDTVIAGLNYPLGIFVNIDSVRTQAAHYAGPHRDRIHFFAVRLVDGVLGVRHAYWDGVQLFER